ncbi:MAG: YkgJ family cysteine cluster protein [Treponema sp.]|nr:YkgJ family cysteine cluster protein [Treponema sp.]
MTETSPVSGPPFECRPACGACCVAPSIAPTLPALPEGKPAGVPCPHLTRDLRCSLWGRPERPSFCGSLKPDPEMCGNGRDHALAYLADLEEKTRP